MALLILSGCGVTPPDDAASPSTARSGSTAAGETPPGDAESSGGIPTDASATDMGDECEYVRVGKAARAVDLPPVTGVTKTGTVTATMTTNQGKVKLTLNRAAAPCTVNSFVSLVRQGFYDDTECHDLQDNRQHTLTCGDPTATGDGGPGYTIPDETTGDEVYRAGTVAMINTPQPDGGSSQFILVFVDSDLPTDYTIFAQMDAKGVGVINRIATEGSDAKGVPNNPAQITSITLD